MTSQETTPKPLIIVSDRDPAAQNIFQRFLEILDLKGTRPLAEKEGGAPIHRIIEYRNFFVCSSETEHLYLDLVDELFTKLTGVRPPLIIFPSKHRSEMNIKSLTIHPTGNFGKAEYGGWDRTFSLSTPFYQSFALRTLHRLWKDFPSSMEGLFPDLEDMTKGKVLKDFSVSFEATHHGPYVNAPAFFIEIGSTANEWTMRKPAMLLAATIYHTIQEWKRQEHGKVKSDAPAAGTVGIGVGGGHYTPRFTKYLLQEGYEYGHIVPGYACELLDEEIIQKLLARTPGAGTIFAHGKKNRKYAQLFLDVDPELELLVLK